MKYKKTILSLFILIAVFLIYFFNVDPSINYIALGDSLAVGQNPYGQVSYGYADYVSNYLDRNQLLKFYTKDFATSGYRIKDVLDDVKNNKKIQVNQRQISLKAALRESDLVSLSIGANDFLANFNLNTIDLDLAKEESLKKKVDEITLKLDDLLQELRKYAKKDVIVIGYYNPLPRMTQTYRHTIERLFDYADKKYQELCTKYDMIYISTYSLFSGHNDYLPNPLDIHPNSTGYEAISNQIIDYLEKKVLN